MYYYTLIFIILAGLILGSFLNVVIFRINDLRSLLAGRSRCPECRAELKWYDLIPIISFILLKTKCRYCGRKISWQYPFVEAGTAIVLTLLFIFYGLTPAFFFYALIFLLMIVVLVHDLRTKLVPEEFVWTILIISLLGSWYFGGFGLPNMLLGGIIAGGFPAFLVVASKEKWMGAGDIKIAMILGLILGYPTAILGLFIAFILGSIVGLILIALHLKKLEDQLPFAPFIISATFIGLVWGNIILNWYFRTFAFGGNY